MRGRLALRLLALRFAGPDALEAGLVDDVGEREVDALLAERCGRLAPAGRRDAELLAEQRQQDPAFGLPKPGSCSNRRTTSAPVDWSLHMRVTSPPYVVVQWAASFWMRPAIAAGNRCTAGGWLSTAANCSGS